MSLRALFAPQGEGLEVKVQGQLAEWPQKLRLPHRTSDPCVLTGLPPQWRDQFATLVFSYFTPKLIFTCVKNYTASQFHNEVIKTVVGYGFEPKLF